MIVTILGCGTSTGVPIIQCKCQVCRSKNPKNRRTRASLWIQTQKKSLLIDSSTDFRLQALREKIARVDAVLYTHPHADHIYGIDDLRCFNFIQQQSIPVYGNAWTKHDLETRFQYIFSKQPPEGAAVSSLDLHLVGAEDKSFMAANVEVTPLPVMHGSKECLGYRVGSVAYITDCSYIPPQTIERLRGVSVLVLDCVRLKAHNTHFNLKQALNCVEEVRPKKTYLTHLGHDFEYTIWNRKLPKGVALAYDGLKIRLKEGTGS